jgi:hypothetical protein
MAVAQPKDESKELGHRLVVGFRREEYATRVTWCGCDRRESHGPFEEYTPRLPPRSSQASSPFFAGEIRPP